MANNPYEDVWVQQALAASMLRGDGNEGAAGGAAGSGADAGGVVDSGGALGSWRFPDAHGGFDFPNAAALEEEELRRALAESVAQGGGAAARGPIPAAAGGRATWGQGSPQRSAGEDEDADLQRALRESAGAAAETEITARPLMGPEGPFCPAGLLNSGNSCFWNALVQALFAATPVFRGALFQLDVSSGGSGDALSVLGKLRDLFAEMDMGLAGAIDAGELYRTLFKRADEADVSEQMHRLFQLATSGPGPLKAVWKELFSGDMYERQRDGPPRRLPLDLCQLDLCVAGGGDAADGGSVPASSSSTSSPTAGPCTSLEELLEAHTQDVQGTIIGRSYRLPPVLWVNLDRFVFDRAAMRGRKRQAQLTFPEVLNVWMLVPPGEPWVQGLRQNGDRMRELQRKLQENRAEVARKSSPEEQVWEGAEEALMQLVEQQEALIEQQQRLEEVMACQGAEQELLYRLQAVIVHSGRVDSGHYYSYSRSPVSGNGRAAWVCHNDATVLPCSTEEMRKKCEGTPDQVGRPATEARPPRSPPRPRPRLVEEIPREQTAESRKVAAGNATAPSGGGSGSPARSPPPAAAAVRPATAAADEKSPASTAFGGSRQGPAVGTSTVSRIRSPRAMGASPSTVAKTNGKGNSGQPGPWNYVSSMFGCWATKGGDVDIDGDVLEVADPARGEAYAVTHVPAGLLPSDPHPWEEPTQQQPQQQVHPMLQEVSENRPLDDGASPGPQAAAEAAAFSPAPSAAEVDGSRGDLGAPGAVLAPAEVAAPEAVHMEAEELENFTAARCLVYVRCGVGHDDLGSLLAAEVRQRVSPGLQEAIAAKNVAFLHKCAGRIAEDFAACIRRLSSSGGGDDDADAPTREALRTALSTAERVRVEGGMGRARMFLLRACWRLHVPWLPEELCPTAHPPDFRMHYGGAAKSALLDALIRLGQHDVASLIVAGTANSDAFVPRDVAEWLAARGFQ